MSKRKTNPDDDLRYIVECYCKLPESGKKRLIQAILSHIPLQERDKLGEFASMLQEEAPLKLK